MSALDELLAACGRGDVDAARRLATPDVLRSLSPADESILPEAAASGRWRTVAACGATGFPINATENSGATAMHYAALKGQVDTVRVLLTAKPALSIRDNEHAATPLGWATWAADFMREPSGDYPSTIRALVEAGGELGTNEHVPDHAESRAALESAKRERLA